MATLSHPSILLVSAPFIDLDILALSSLLFQQMTEKTIQNKFKDGLLMSTGN